MTERMWFVDQPGFLAKDAARTWRHFDGLFDAEPVFRDGMERGLDHLQTLTGEDPRPVLWPEPQRAFFQDGPGLLLTPEQAEELLALDEAGRDAFIERFLADPVLREGIERRKRLAFEETLVTFYRTPTEPSVIGP